MNYQRHFLKIPSYINWYYWQWVPSHTISYLEWGSFNSDKVIFCVHSLIQNAHSYDRFAEIALEEGYRIISIDIVGRGHSQWFHNHKYYNYGTYLKDCSYLLKHLKVKEVTWLGSSMGGIMGMIMAALKPKLIKTLIMNDVGPDVPKKQVRRIGDYMSKEVIFHNFAEAKSYFKVAFSKFGITDEEDWDDLVKNSIKLRTDGKYQPAYDRQLVKGMNHEQEKSKRNVDLWKFWKKIDCPVMLLHGTISKILLPITIHKMQQIHVDTKVLPIEGVGHVPALVHRDLNVAIIKWIKYRGKCE